MNGENRFPFERVARLDSPERKARQPAEPLVELVAETAPSRVLDIGVGTGYFGIELARRLPEARILGVDIEPRMLELFRARAAEAGLAERVETHQTPAEHADGLPLGDDAADAALQVNLYHELDDRLHHLREIRRVLVPGGRVVLCDWDPEGTRESGPPAHVRIPLATVEAELTEAGFGDVRSHALYDDYYVVTGTA